MFVYESSLFLEMKDDNVERWTIHKIILVEILFNLGISKQAADISFPYNYEKSVPTQFVFVGSRMLPSSFQKTLLLMQQEHRIVGYHLWQYLG